MRVSHLNCGTMNPPTMSPIVCHVLLCETDDGLVLVDSGLGRADFANPKRMGPGRFLTRPARADAETAAAQVEARGHALSDVTHIVLTHMDFDHVGGVSDFPDAVVHTTADEYDWAVANPDFTSKQRYSQKQWAHGPRFETHAGPGDDWRFGLTGIEVLPGITYVPMPGHTKGHAAVAVEPDGEVYSCTLATRCSTRARTRRRRRQVGHWARSASCGPSRRSWHRTARSSPATTRRSLVSTTKKA